MRILLFALALLCVRPCQADVAATYNSAADIPVTVSSFSAAGATFSATLNFAPTAGTTLIVVKNTGLGFINGTFSNLAQGQVVTLSYNGIKYQFIANYYGGTGNDLVLQWAPTRPVAWGDNGSGQLGNNSMTNSLVPVDVLSTGVLARKTVVSAASGLSHSLALCSDGTLAAWGSNLSGELGNGSATQSKVPVAVNTTGVLSGKAIVAIATGQDHSLALCSDGTLAAWGGNSSGQLGNSSALIAIVPLAVDTAGVLAGKTVIAVAAGANHSLALCSDGTVAAWGDNYSGQLGNNSTISSTVPVAANTAGVLAGKTVIAVAAGRDHSLAVCSDGTVAAWGNNSSGQLGNNTMISHSMVPIAVNTTGVLSGKTVIAVAAGSTHSLALCSDGTLAAWGNDTYGQLGNSDVTNDISVPVAVDTTGVLAGKMVVAVAAGEAHSLALCSDGTVVAWGRNSSGQLGNNSTTKNTVPTAVSSSSLDNGERYAAVFSGSCASHNFGLVASPSYPMATSLAATNLTKTGATLNGIVNPNGSATIAQFEYGTTTSYGSSASVTLTPNDGLDMQSVRANLSDLAPGTNYHYRLTVTNAVSTISTFDGTFTTSIDVAATYNSTTDIPVTVSSFSAAGATFSATLNFAPTTGTTLMVVKNTGLGFINGTFSNLAQGQVITLSYSGIKYQFIANYYGGTGNDLVLQWAQTRPVAWGDNGSGQLGNNSMMAQSRVPVAVDITGVLAGKTVVAVTSGESHSLALCSDGTLAAWGNNLYGQLGNNGSLNRRVPVAVNTTGVLSGKTVVAVAAGQYHSLALCSDGTLAAWGYNFYGQLGNNSTSNSRVPVAVNTAGVLAGKTVISVAAGVNHSLALCSDGTLAAWGHNTNGQLGNNSTTISGMPVAVDITGVLAGKEVVALAAGQSHSLALCSDGTLATWGSGFLVPFAVNTTGVLSGKTVIAVAAGSTHSLALCSDGTLAAWGNNTNGQLGNNSTTTSSMPVAVDITGVLAGKEIVALAAGQSHSLALCSDGTLAAWGANFAGQLGNNSPTRSTVPVAVNSSPLGTGERYAATFRGSNANHSLSLIASPPAPVATSLAATDLSSDSAVLHGTVNAASGSAAVSFEYGLDSSYGGTVTATASPVTGSIDTPVSADVTGLAPNTTYHYRVRATSSGGTATGEELTFTTLPDTASPKGGSVTLTPGSPVEAGAAFTVTFANWKDQSLPLTYSVLFDDVLVSAQGAPAVHNVTAPATAGTHTLKGRIYDALGHVTEVVQNFTVIMITTQEEWRTFYFGTAQNEGDAADLADPDGDGGNNLFEYVAGLVPTNPIARFNVRVEAVAGQPGQKAITFSPVLGGRSYTVKYKASLTDEVWTPLTNITTSDNGTERTVTDLSAGSEPRFYRVEITRP